MIQFLKKAPDVICCLTLIFTMTGCAQHTWSPGPGLTLADFEPAKASCSMFARNNGTGFAAYGSQSYVAGAALGNAIGNSIKAQADFNDCMSAHGWRITTPETIAINNTKSAQIKDAGRVYVGCIADVRARPEYGPIQLYMTDLNGTHVPMELLSLDRTPSIIEAKAYTSYWDAVEPCRERRNQSIGSVSPSVASVVAAAVRIAGSDVERLVSRQETWGTFFHNMDAHSQQTKEELTRTVL